jgi:hypothetical protein
MLTIIGWILAMPVMIAWRGYVLSLLWAWFAVPMGLPPIGVAMACGLSTVVALLTLDASVKRDEPNLALAVAGGIFIPLFALALGAVIRTFL